jgi:hypothetical protein
MGLGRIARGLGKVGLLIEGGVYVLTAVRALTKALKGDPAARRDTGVRQSQDGNTDDQRRDQSLPD